MTLISPKAIIDNPEMLADDVSVGAFTYIGPNVKVAENVKIGSNVTIEGHVEIGSGSVICPYAVIGSMAGSTQAMAANDGTVVIGRNNNIREHAVIYSGSKDGCGTRLGNDNLIMTGCCIGSDVTVEDGVVMGNYSSFAAGARLERFVWSAAFTGVDEGVRIGRYSFTSGYAGINADAPPYAMLQGFPFKVRGANSLNLKRHGFSEKQIETLKKAFKLLYSRKADMAAAAAEIAQWPGDEHLDYLMTFVHATLAAKSAEQEGRP